MAAMHPAHVGVAPPKLGLARWASGPHRPIGKFSIIYTTQIIGPGGVVNIKAEPLTFASRGSRVGGVKVEKVMELEGFVDSSAILRSGVYALIAKGRVIYVGKSRSMIGRINTHRRAWIDKRKTKSEGSWIANALGIPGLMFDEIHIRPAPLHDLDRLEREMIDKYKPHYNVQLQTNAKIRAPINLVIGGLTLRLNQHQPQVLRR